jgi:hypothetical protein
MLRSPVVRLRRTARAAARSTPSGRCWACDELPDPPASLDGRRIRSGSHMAPVLHPQLVAELSGLVRHRTTEGPRRGTCRAVGRVSASDAQDTRLPWKTTERCHEPSLRRLRATALSRPLLAPYVPGPTRRGPNSARAQSSLGSGNGRLMGSTSEERRGRRAGLEKILLAACCRPWLGKSANPTGPLHADDQSVETLAEQRGRLVGRLGPDLGDAPCGSSRGPTSSLRRRVRSELARLTWAGAPCGPARPRPAGP